MSCCRFRVGSNVASAGHPKGGTHVQAIPDCAVDLFGRRLVLVPCAGRSAKPTKTAAATQTAGAAKTSGRATIKGVDYYYEVRGQGEPLLILHGGLGSIDMFEPLLPTFTQSRQVIGVDLQGHGRIVAGQSTDPLRGDRR